MSIATLKKETAKLRIQVQAQRQIRTHPALDLIRKDPANLFRLGGVGEPDLWQKEFLSSDDPQLLLCASRQVGKSQVTAALVLKEALLNPGSVTLLVSRSLRQSQEMLKAKVKPMYRRLGRPVPLARPRESELSMEFANGSRILALPGDEETLRCFTASLIVVDEAARVPTETFNGISPMRAVSKGRMVMLSSAWATIGYFYEEYAHGTEWRKFTIPANMCSRLTPEFLASERRRMGDRAFRREYYCQFTGAIDQYFDSDSITAALVPGQEPPLF